MIPSLFLQLALVQPDEAVLLPESLTELDAGGISESAGNPVRTAHCDAESLLRPSRYFSVARTLAPPVSGQEEDRVNETNPIYFSATCGANLQGARATC